MTRDKRPQLSGQNKTDLMPNSASCKRWDTLIETITRLNDRKIGFKSITENIDTTTSGGKLVFHIFGALAEFERDIIKDRTKAGLHAARARGRLGGRPKAKTLDTPKKVALAQSLYENGDNSIDEICETLHVSRATLYRYIKTKTQP